MDATDEETKMSQRNDIESLINVMQTKGVDCLNVSQGKAIDIIARFDARCIISDRFADFAVYEAKVEGVTLRVVSRTGACIVTVEGDLEPDETTAPVVFEGTVSKGPTQGARVLLQVISDAYVMMAEKTNTGWRVQRVSRASIAGYVAIARRIFGSVRERALAVIAGGNTSMSGSKQLTRSQRAAVALKADMINKRALRLTRGRSYRAG